MAIVEGSYVFFGFGSGTYMYCFCPINNLDIW